MNIYAANERMIAEGISNYKIRSSLSVDGVNQEGTGTACSKHLRLQELEC